MNDTRVGRGLSLAFVWFWGELIPFDFLCFIFDYILFIPLFFLDYTSWFGFWIASKL